MKKKQLETLYKDVLPQRIKRLEETGKTDVVPYFIHFYWNFPPTKKARLSLIYDFLTNPNPDIDSEEDLPVIRDTLFCRRLCRIVVEMLRQSLEWHPYPTISEMVEGEDYDKVFRKYARETD